MSPKSDSYQAAWGSGTQESAVTKARTEAGTSNLVLLSNTHRAVAADWEQGKACLRCMKAAKKPALTWGRARHSTV